MTSTFAGAGKAAKYPRPEGMLLPDLTAVASEENALDELRDFRPAAPGFDERVHVIKSVGYVVPYGEANRRVGQARAFYRAPAVVQDDTVNLFYPGMCAEVRVEFLVMRR